MDSEQSDANPDRDETTSRVDKIRGLMGHIGQLFASKTIEALPDDTLVDACDKLSSVFHKVCREREVRNSSKKDASVAALTVMGKIDETAQTELRRIFATDHTRTKKTDAALSIISFFRDNGRATFTMDEAIKVVHVMKMETIYGHTDDLKLRIVLGDVLGRNGLNLVVTQTSDRQRIYAIP